MERMSKEKRSNIMRHIKSKNTKPEVTLRKALWHRGIRYRKYYKKLPGTPDIAITRCKIAIFVDGDFWHAKGHTDNPGEQIRTNKAFWVKKLKNNVERDRAVNDELTEMGWLVFHFWSSDIENDLEKHVNLIADYCKK